MTLSPARVFYVVPVASTPLASLLHRLHHRSPLVFVGFNGSTVSVLFQALVRSLSQAYFTRC